MERAGDNPSSSPARPSKRMERLAQDLRFSAVIRPVPREDSPDRPEPEWVEW